MRDLPEIRNGLFLPFFTAFLVASVSMPLQGWRFAGAAWLLCVFGHVMHCRWAIAWRKGRDMPRIGQELWLATFIGSLFWAIHSLRGVIEFPLDMLLMISGFLSAVGIGVMVCGGLPTWRRWRPPMSSQQPTANSQ